MSVFGQVVRFLVCFTTLPLSLSLIHGKDPSSASAYAKLFSLSSNKLLIKLHSWTRSSSFFFSFAFLLRNLDLCFDESMICCNIEKSISNIYCKYLGIYSKYPTQNTQVPRLFVIKRNNILWLH